jgi:hypothetical protein
MWSNLYKYRVFVCQRPWCPTRSTRWAMFGSGLHRAGTGRCHLLERAAWWGIQGPLMTRISFGGGRVGQARCGGRRPPKRWYVDVSERRTSTSVAICICWISLLIGVGRFFRDLTLAMVPLAFHIFGLLPSVAQHQVDVDYSWCVM